MAPNWWIIASTPVCVWPFRLYFKTIISKCGIQARNKIPQKLWKKLFLFSLAVLSKVIKILGGKCPDSNFAFRTSICRHKNMSMDTMWLLDPVESLESVMHPTGHSGDKESD